MVYVLIFVFVFGVVIGSFLNVVILRYGTGQSFVKGSSRCFSCGKKLSWHELVPIFSFLIQKGRCRGCGSKISWQYPVVEFLTGALFVATFFQLSTSEVDSWRVLFLWVIVSLLIIISVYDIKHFIIPNKIVWIFNGLAFAMLFCGFFYQGPSLVVLPRTVLGSFLGGLAFFSFFALLWAVSRGRWMGFGDAKLALGLGWFLGPSQTFSAFLISFWLGAVVGIGLLALSKYSLKSQIPFGPFLVAGAVISFLFDLNIFGLLYGG